MEKTSVILLFTSEIDMLSQYERQITTSFQDMTTGIAYIIIAIHMLISEMFSWEGYLDS